MNTKIGKPKILALFAALIMSLSIIPVVNAADLTGGGDVSNSPPWLVSITIDSDQTNGGNEGNFDDTSALSTNVYNNDGDDYVIIHIVACDNNSEEDMAWINVTCNQDPNGADTWMNHEITATDWDETSPQAGTEKTIKGWDNGTGDYLYFSFKFTYTNDDAPTGNTGTSVSWQWTATIKDTAGSTDDKSLASHNVYNYADVVAVDGYFASNGDQNSSDLEWGNWSSPAGTDNVEAKNYLKGTSDGNAQGTLDITWDTSNLVKGGDTIALSNLEHYYDEEASPGAASWNSEGTGNSVSATISDKTSSQIVGWWRYTIDLPPGTPVGSYEEGFTYSFDGIVPA